MALAEDGMAANESRPISRFETSWNPIARLGGLHETFDFKLLFDAIPYFGTGSYMGISNLA